MSELATNKTASPSDEKTILGYVMTMGDDGTWMYCGRTPEEVGNTVCGEFQGHDGLKIDEIEEYHIEPRMFSQKELDEMPDFPGW